VNIFLVLTFSGVALGAIYFLAASGLSLIYGLMDVLNFAHGLFMTLGAYAGYEVATRLPTSLGAPTLVILAIIGATLFGGLAAGVTELDSHPAALRQADQSDLDHDRLGPRGGRPPHGGLRQYRACRSRCRSG
jgi:branched-subunit amino acid ABC-type transport system permease component